MGNAYCAELLFRHQLDPLWPGCELRTDQWAALWSDLVGLMGDGMRRGRIDTVRSEHDPIRTGRAPRQDRHGGEVYVYRRAGAPFGVWHDGHHDAARGTQPLPVPLLPVQPAL
ncbi:MAG: hypothetical protein JO281_03625 [Pseudonocardiales bacterium]|nr:hypothetical protein [Pseudonocardiales bacterium]